MNRFSYVQSIYLYRFNIHTGQIKIQLTHLNSMNRYLRTEPLTSIDSLE